MTEDLLVDFSNEVCSLTLNRPAAGNSLSPSLVEALHRALDEAERARVGALVLRGAGRNFCTGFDLADVAAASDGDLLLRFVRIEELLARIYIAPFATVAVAQGRTIGAGADLFVACTMRIAMPDASFSFPGAVFGLVLGTRRLAARIGVRQAQALITGGDEVDAVRAADIGLATVRAPAEPRALIEAELDQARRLPLGALAEVRSAFTDGEPLDTDLARLVRSAARGGLAQRIAAYRQQKTQASSTRQMGGAA
jgi:enoyl-CoA hydratase